MGWWDRVVGAHSATVRKKRILLKYLVALKRGIVNSKTYYGIQFLQRTKILARFAEDCFSPDPPPPVRQLWLEIRPQR